MESIDDLLAKVKAEYNPSQPVENPQKQPPPPDSIELKNPAILETSPLLNEILTEDHQRSPEQNLIAQLKAEYENPQPKNNEGFAIPPLLSNFEVSTRVSQSWSTDATPGLEHHLIAELSTEYEEQQRIEEQKKQEQIRAEQLRQEQLNQQKRQALTQQAQEWLKKLEPLSDEGFWFEQFASRYPSKLEAAIDYLLALQETAD